MNYNAREVCLEALLLVYENEGYSNIVLNKKLNTTELSKRDKSLVSIIFYGVLEKKITLDYFIDIFLKNKKMKISDVCRYILEMAVYQIVYLDKIPESAAVNEAVNLAKKYKVSASFINGILRNMLRNKNLLVLPDDTSINSLSVKYSIPEELIKMWNSQYGENTTLRLLSSFQEKSKNYIRINNTKNSVSQFIGSIEDNTEVNIISQIDNACEIKSSGDITKLIQFENGLFHVEDLSSQFLCKIIDPQPDDVVCDVCAAPGGKSFTLAERMKDRGKVYSFDLYKGRVNLIKKGAERLSLSSIDAKIRDALNDFSFTIEADKVLCDVPCSGFGVIRKKPEIRYKSIESIKGLADIQYGILCNSSKLVKHGGVLIYSTCTLNANENNMVADKFLQNNLEFEPYPIKTELVRTINEPENQFTIMPCDNDCDGFFISMFIRK